MPKFKREIEIDAPVEKVWDVITNPGYWPQWFPGIEGVSDVTSLGEGTTLTWTHQNEVGHASIIRFEPLKRLDILTQLGDDKDTHIFKLRPSGGFLGLAQDECKVEYTLDTMMGGGILGNFVAGGNPQDVMRVKKSMHLLRRLVESL